MNFPLSFPSFVIFAHFFWPVSSDTGMEKLKKAIARDDVEIVKKFLHGENKERVLHGTLNIKVNNRFSRPREDSRLRIPGNGALHWAVMHRSPKVTRLLLEYGANVNVFNFEGLTPLFLVTINYLYLEPPHEKNTRENSESVADILLEFKPDIHVRNDMGVTPLKYAAGYCNVSLVAKLLALGGNVNDRWPGVEETPLHRAVDNGCVEVTKFLLENGAEADADNGYGVNALHIIFNTRYLYWTLIRDTAMEDQASIAKLLLKSNKVDYMLKQRENRDLKTPVDIFFEQSDPNRAILVDLLKILPTLDDEYALTALRTISPSLEENSSAWPLNDFPGYVKIAFNTYFSILSKLSYTITGIVRKSSVVNCISPEDDIKYFMDNGLYSLYVILKIHFQIYREKDREEAVVEVEKFDEYLGELSVPFQNALSNAVAQGTTLEILPTHVLTEIFLRSQYAPFIERMAKIMSLVQFSQAEWWSVEEMVEAAPALIHYIEQQDILLL